VTRRRSAALIALLAIAVGACSAKPSAKNQAPVSGGTLDVTMRDLGTLDPAKATGRGALLVVSQVFDSLTAIDPSTGLVKAAAASSWTTSADGKTWRFVIAANSFHNGSPVRAQDFKFAFDRLVRKALDSDIAYLLEPVVGYHAVHVAGTTQTLAGVSAPKDTELVIKLDRPFDDLLYNLADPGLAPLPAQVYARSTKDLANAPIGNGPFKLASATPAVKATLIRYDAYGGTRAYLDGVNFHVVANVDDGWRSYLAHTTDITDIPTTEVGGKRGFDDRGLTAIWATLSFGPNLRLPKYKDARTRQAMSLAIDRAAIARNVFVNYDPATGLVPRGLRGYLPDQCAACLKVDQTRARSLLAAVFHGKNPSIVIDHLSDQTSKLVARAIANDLNAVGFHASLSAHDPGAYKRLLASRKQDFAELGWVADTPTPDGFLGQQLSAGSPNNPTGYRDRVFEIYLSRARASTEEAPRLANYEAAERRALSLMPLIPIVFYRNRTAVATRVRGFFLDGAGIFDCATIWLSR
jgi:ABC-type oligopeptide transport system substrate-binding subunit